MCEVCKIATGYIVDNKSNFVHLLSIRHSLGTFIKLSTFPDLTNIAGAVETTTKGGK